MKKILSAITVALAFASSAFPQIAVTTQIRIVKAEDARAYDKTLEDLMRSPEPEVRTRAALAAGRIGNDAAVPALITILENDPSPKVRAMAAFALGEIESIKAADAILKKLKTLKADTQPVGSVSSVTAKLIEAAGKIAAANAKDPKSKTLGEAIIETLDAKFKNTSHQSGEIVLMGMTAALRARPENAALFVAKFLSSGDPRIRADAANTLGRLRSKIANDTLRAMLLKDKDAVARAGAARALGAAEDNSAFDMLLYAATTDADSRVRVSAIRSLAALKDPKAAEALLKHGETLLAKYKKVHTPKFTPTEHSELIEIAVVLGRLLTDVNNERAISLFREFGRLDKGRSPEIYIARMRVAPGQGGDERPDLPELSSWRQYSTIAQVIGEFASLEPVTAEGRKRKAEAPEVIRPMAQAFAAADPKVEMEWMLAASDTLRAFARFKTPDLAELLREAMTNKDVQIRATAANLLGDLPPSKENVEALEAAFAEALTGDKLENDALLSILDALFKLDKKGSLGAVLTALDAPDFLVRKKAFELLKTLDSKESPDVHSSIERAVKQRKDQVLPYIPINGTKLGQILNSDADYRRAVSRKNGSVKAVFTTAKGSFTIDFFPEEAPLTVDNFVKLARSRYFDGLEVHRVVPNFVMQDGDPRGDGNGGPGWSIRCEVNMREYDRGAVGMALSGKDTGGSQWFVTHSPQPHLDGGYTVFGHVDDVGMKVVDNIVRGDKIISVKIVERKISPQSTQRTQEIRRGSTGRR